MTTAPVMTITEELLSELEDKAKASNSIGPWYTTKNICAFTYNEEDGAFVIAVSPATLLALDEHIRSLTERLEKAEKDAGRYRWLREQQWNTSPLCAVARPKDAVKLGHDCPSLDRLDDAIDAAIAQEASHE